MNFTEKIYVWVVINEVEQYIFGVFSTEEKAYAALQKRHDRSNFIVEGTEVQ